MRRLPPPIPPDKISDALMAQPIPFFKYQGAGNDFVLIDARQQMPLDPDDEVLIRQMCDRRFGIGADGLMLLREAPGYDFEMLYFNSDGRPSTMCGNGGRCMVAFAHRLGIVQHECHFLAIDGGHQARLLRPDWVELQLQDVNDIRVDAGAYCLNTGSPHYVRFVSSLESIDVQTEGKAVRYSSAFAQEGINVNFAAVCSESRLQVATYERGVEAETLSCGTGVTAAAIAYAAQQQRTGILTISVHTKGGDMEVRFNAGEDGFRQVWLCGPAVAVFQGVYG